MRQLAFLISLVSLSVLFSGCGGMTPPAPAKKAPDGLSKEVKQKALAVCMSKIKNQIVTAEYGKIAKPAPTRWVDYNKLKQKLGDKPDVKKVITETDVKFSKLKFSLGNVRQIYSENGKCKCDAVFVMQGSETSRQTMKVQYVAEFADDGSLVVNIFGVNG